MPDHRLGLRTVGTPSLKEGVGRVICPSPECPTTPPSHVYAILPVCDLRSWGRARVYRLGKTKWGGGGAGEPAYMLGEDFPVQLPWGHSL